MKELVIVDVMEQETNAVQHQNRYILRSTGKDQPDDEVRQQAGRDGP